MVQLVEPDLQSLVLEAWRQCWSELEWSVKLNSALIGTSDQNTIDHLSELLLKQATLTDTPNELMFTYLTYVVCSQVVTHVSFLKAVVSFTDFQKTSCLKSVLSILYTLRSMLRCNGLNDEQCVDTCFLVTRLFDWFLLAIDFAYQNNDLALIVDVCELMFKYVSNSLILLCLRFASLENPHEYKILCDHAALVYPSLINLVHIPENIKSDLSTFMHRISKLEEYCCEGILELPYCRKEFRGAMPTIISMAVLYGSVLFADSLESFIFAIKSVKEVQILSWEEIIIDLIRGSAFLELDATSSIPDSHFTAFTYLKLPRIIKCLCAEEIPKDVLFSAFCKVAGFRTLFNSADLKSRCDTFHFLFQEFSKLGLISETDVNLLMEERNKEKYNLAETPTENQPNVTLVLKAEPTLQTLLKSFSSDIIQKQEKLAQMMHHMISGKSFEFICAAAAATGKIRIFTAKLIEFNETSKSTGSTEEPDKDLALGGELFDLSFLLLSRIAQLYSVQQILYPLSTSKSFFESWCSRYCISSVSPSDDAATESMEMEQDDDLSEIFQWLKTGQNHWMSGKNWDEICEKIPPIGQSVLNELKNESLSAEEMTNMFTSLLWVKVNGVQWICSLLLCLAQWIVQCKPNDERRKLASYLFCFIDTHVPGTERTKATERQVFMANVTKRMLSPLLSSSKVPQSLHPWLHSVKRLSTVQIPDEDPLLLPNADVLHILLAKCLQQGWVLSSVFVMIEKFTRLGEIRKFIKALIDELQKLIVQEEIITWCDLTLACCLVSPRRCFCDCVDAMVNFVLEPGRDLFCVSPRGPVLAHFLVQLYLISLKFCSSQLCEHTAGTSEGSSDSQHGGPATKVTKLQQEPAPAQKCEVEDFSAIVFSLEMLYGKFMEICQDRTINPSVSFVAHYLHCLAQYTSTEAEFLMAKIPVELFSLVIRIDPNMLPLPVLFTLFNIGNKAQRLEVLRSVCYLRQSTHSLM